MTLDELYDVHEFMRGHHAIREFTFAIYANPARLVLCSCGNISVITPWIGAKAREEILFTAGMMQALYDVGLKKEISYHHRRMHRLAPHKYFTAPTPMGNILLTEVMNNLEGAK